MLLPGDLYVDHNATTPLLPAVRAALERALAEELVNPASPHLGGERTRRKLEQARAEVAELVGAAPEEIVFTSGGTESNHLALRVLPADRLAEAHVVVPEIEHSSLLAPVAALEARGLLVTRVGPDRDGRVRVPALLAALRPETRWVALMHANNETGILQPVEEVAAELATRSIPFHVDGVQAAGRIAIDLKHLPAATYSLSAHKLGGPAGCGALFVRRGLRLPPLLGGGRQERGRRGGTHNTLGIVGFGAAARASVASGGAAASVARDAFERGLARVAPEAVLNGAALPRLPNTSSVTFGARDGARLLAELSRRGVFASAGSACQAGSPEPSHVLRAMGRSLVEIRATLRFSFGREQGTEEAGRLLERLDDALRALPPPRGVAAFPAIA